MANPQVENGYTRIANELLDAICRLKISGNEHCILWYIVRKTYGFHTKNSAISLQEISRATGIAKSHVSVALKNLAEYGIIKKASANGTRPQEISIEKDYEKWVALRKSVTVTECVTVTENGNSTVTEIGNLTVTENGNHTYKYNNKNNSKNSVCTHTRQKIKISEIIEIAEQLGYYWSEQEAQAFLDYNLDRGRKNGWEYAVKKWEENRKKRCGKQHGKRRELPEMTPQEIAEMNEYLSLANRFDEDGS